GADAAFTYDAEKVGILEQSRRSSHRRRRIRRYRYALRTRRGRRSASAERGGRPLLAARHSTHGVSTTVTRRDRQSSTPSASASPSIHSTSASTARPAPRSKPAISSARRRPTPSYSR